MTTWNSGILYQKDFESDYNAVRRFLIANVAQGNRFFRSTYSTHRVSSRAFEIIKGAQTAEYWDSNSWLYLKNWGHNYSLPPMKQCPTCAEQLFHSHAYSLSWLTNCPLHKTPLVSSCPACDQPWFGGIDIVARECIYCGATRPDDLLTRRDQILPHNKDYSRLLHALWQITQLKIVFSVAVYCDYIGNGVEFGISPNNSGYPALAVSCFPEYRDLLDDIVEEENLLLVEHHRVEPLPPREVGCVVDRKPCAVIDKKRVIDSVNREIMEEANLIGIELNRYDRNRSYIADFAHDYDAVILAYIIWLNMLDPPKEGEPRRAWWWRVFELLATARPLSPPVINFVYDPISDMAYDLPVFLTEWFYKMQLVHLLGYLCEKMGQLITVLGMDNPQESLFIVKGRIPQILSSYQGYKLRMMDSGILQVVYKPLPSIRGILSAKYQLPEIRETNIYNYDMDQGALMRYARAKFDKDLLSIVKQEVFDRRIAIQYSCDTPFCL